MLTQSVESAVIYLLLLKRTAVGSGSISGSAMNTLQTLLATLDELLIDLDGAVKRGDQKEIAHLILEIRALAKLIDELEISGE